MSELKCFSNLSKSKLFIHTKGGTITILHVTIIVAKITTIHNIIAIILKNLNFKKQILKNVKKILVYIDTVRKHYEAEERERQ